MKHRTHKGRSGYPDHGVGEPNAIIIPAGRRILSLGLALCLLLAMVLVVPGPVEVSAVLPSAAAGQLYDGIDFDALAASNSGIYYGVYNHYNGSSYPDGDTPILWRVMGEEDSSGKLTLLSEYVLDTHVFNSSYYGGNAQNYVDSELNTWLNGTFATQAFEQAETNGIVLVDVVTGMYDRSSGTHLQGDHYPQHALNDGGSYILNNNAVQTVNTGPWPKEATGQQFYLPHGGYDNNKVYWEAGNTRDAAYELASNYSGNIAPYKNGSPTSYWLRSPHSDYSLDALCVYTDGSGNHFFVNASRGVRPAFQLNPSTVPTSPTVKRRRLTDTILLPAKPAAIISN